MRAFKTIPLSFVSFVFSFTVSGSSFASAPCSIEFEGFGIFQPGPVTIDRAVDYLVQFDESLSAATSTLRSDISSSSALTGSQRQALLNEFESRYAAVKDQYEELTNKALEWSVSEAQREFPSRVEALRRSAESTVVQTRTALRREQGASFNELTDNPELISSKLVYEVPQPSSTSGNQSVNKLSVKFNDAVISELRKDPHSASRFLRSMVKGYVGAHAGDGILRITDQHEALVEIKFVSKGNSRLIGCRRAGGLIELLRFYEKHNEGGSGSLKRFAKLCDE